MSQIDFEEEVSRVGMQVLGGNLSRVPWSSVAEEGYVGNLAWAGKHMGMFIVNSADSKTIELDALAKTDVIVCSAVLNPNGAQTSFAVGDGRFDVKNADMRMVFVPRQEHYKFEVMVPGGLKSVTVVVDVMSMLKARGLPAATLPDSLLRTIRGREVVIKALDSRYFGVIGRDVFARRAMFPSFAALYYEGKTFEMVSALVSDLSWHDALRAGQGVFDPGVLDRLDLVKQIIDRAPHRVLDVDDLARVAAMNRTKLRSAFRHVYGTTLSAYRTAIMLQRADSALKKSGASVKQAARHAGYASTSSFITAYKRKYGIRPGVVLRD